MDIFNIHITHIPHITHITSHSHYMDIIHIHKDMSN